MNILILTIDSPFDIMGGLGMSIKTQTLYSKNNFISFGPGETKIEGNLQHIEIENFKQNMSEKELEIFENKLVEIILKELEDRSFKVDVIHVFEWFMISLGQKLSKRLSKNFLYTIALSTVYQIIDIYKFFSKVFPKESEKMLRNNKKTLNKLSKVEKDVLETAKNIVFVSGYYKKLYLSDYPDYSDKFNVIYNGIDLKEYQKPIEKEYKIPGSNKLKVLYMGRFCMQKNSSFLLDINIPKDIDILFAGGPDGSQPSMYNRMLEQCKKEGNKFFLGFLKGEKKRYFLKNVDAVIVPSIHEPFGIINLEVMASKTILINSFSSGMDEYLTRKFTIDCGLLPENMENSLDVLKNLCKKQKYEMIEGNYSIVKKFSCKKQSKLYDDLYENSI